MIDKDTLIQQTLLAVSPEHIDRYAQLPPSAQDKIRDMIVQLAEHHQITGGYRQDYETDDNWNELNKKMTQLVSSPLRSHDGVLPLTQTNPITTSNDQFVTSINETSKELQKHLNTFPENPYTNDLEVLPDGSLKLDITSTRESLYAGIGCMAPFILLAGFISEISIFYYIGISALIWGTRQAMRTDDFLKFKPENNEIFYHRQNGDKTSLSSYLKLDDVLCIAVQGSQNSSKESSWWEYKPIAITNRGELLDLGDQKKSDYVNCFAFTRKLAQVLQTDFFDEFQPEAKLEITIVNSEIQVYYSS